MKILKMNIKNLHIILGLLSVLFSTVIANGFDGDAIKEDEMETELRSIEKEDRSLESHEAMQGGNSAGATASPNVHTSRPNTFDGKFFANDDRDKRMQAAYIANLPDPNASESLLELLVTIAAQPERWNDLIRYVNKVLKTRVTLDPNLQPVNTEYQHNISKQVSTDDSTANLMETADENKQTTSTQDNIQHMIILLNTSKTQNKKSHNLDQQLNDLKYIHANISEKAKLQTTYPTTQTIEKQSNRDTNNEYNDQSTAMYVNNYDKNYVTSSYSNKNNKDNKDETETMIGSNKRPYQMDTFDTIINDPTLITPSRASDDYQYDKDNAVVDPQLTTKDQSTIATQQTVTEKAHGTNNGRETFAFHRVTVRPSDKTRARNAYIAVSVIAPRLRQYYGNKRDELESELLRLKQPPWSHKRNLRNMQNLRTKWNITTLPAVTP